MVAGGYNAEVLSNESSMTNKKLAELPKRISKSPSLFRNGDNLLLCGGYNNENKCLMHDNDSWKEHSTLTQNRSYASAVTTADGTFIFGGTEGTESEDTFEFLPKNSKVWNQGGT